MYMFGGVKKVLVTNSSFRNLSLIVIPHYLLDLFRYLISCLIALVELALWWPIAYGVSQIIHLVLN